MCVFLSLSVFLVTERAEPQMTIPETGFQPDNLTTTSLTAGLGLDQRTNDVNCKGKSQPQFQRPSHGAQNSCSGFGTMAYMSLLEITGLRLSELDFILGDNHWWLRR